jgi:hypothetical protein
MHLRVTACMESPKCTVGRLTLPYMKASECVVSMAHQSEVSPNVSCMLALRMTCFVSRSITWHILVCFFCLSCISYLSWLDYLFTCHGMSSKLLNPECIQDKVGTAFLLLDSFAAGVISMLAGALLGCAASSVSPVLSINKCVYMYAHTRASKG